jgi:O-acetyl-ADP-ribose deacetylase
MIQVLQGDITKQAVDAIVNAANTSLLGGGGVDGAIHRAAGPALLAECRTLHGCPTGDAKLTKGYRLPARYVIHAVGPVWQDGQHGEPELLANCYRRALELATENNLFSIAFPNISTGVYGYPKDKAADVAIASVRQFLQQSTSVHTVHFVCFDAENYQLYQQKCSL